MCQEYDFKVGDLVVVSSRWSEKVLKVEKITPTGRIKVGGSYYTKDGSMIGGDAWDRSRIIPATEEMIDSIEKKRYMNLTLKRMHDFKKELSHDDALSINKILSNYINIED